MSELDPEFVQALVQSMMNAEPAELIKSLQGTKVDIPAIIAGVPMEIGIRIKNGEILARVKFTQEEKSEDGDKPESG